MTNNVKLAHAVADAQKLASNQGENFTVYVNDDGKYFAVRSARYDPKFHGPKIQDVAP